MPGVRIGEFALGAVAVAMEVVIVRSSGEALPVPASGRTFGRRSAGSSITAMRIIQAVRLHESRQTRVVRLVALGARERMLIVGAPSLNRLMNPVEAFEGAVLVRPVGQRIFFVTLEAQSGKLAVALADAISIVIDVGGRERVPVNAPDWCQI